MTTSVVREPAPRAGGRLGALAAACHPGPAVAVTLVAALLAVAADVDAAGVVLVTVAVGCGQLTIGWGNDLLDRERDLATGRADKPLAAGGLDPRFVVRCLAVALLGCVALSLACGWRSGAVHLLAMVAMGHAYNLGLKATAWSWVPYAVAFGSLPAVASLAADPPRWPAWWLLAAGAALGVGAHLVNALPDLDDDLRSGVRGLPHRLGGRGSRLLAVALLAAGSVLAALGPAGAPPAWVIGTLVVAATLLVVAAIGRGRVPFQAAVALAVLDVVLLVAGS